MRLLSLSLFVLFAVITKLEQQLVHGYWIPSGSRLSYRSSTSTSNCHGLLPLPIQSKTTKLAATVQDEKLEFLVPFSPKKKASSSSSHHRHVNNKKNSNNNNTNDNLKMPDQTNMLTEATKNDSGEKDDETVMSPELIGAGAVAAFVTIIAGLTTASHLDAGPTDLVQFVQGVFQNPSSIIDQVVQSVESMGPLGTLYFGLAYTMAEVLAIPAMPLTAAAGYLFGPVEGTAVVLLSASVAAAISFLVGRTLLRNYVESVLEEYPKFAKIDRAIGKEGFKLMLLLRLSPIFPFALSNYLYGASSINFTAFFWGTLLGFAPGTVAYVYTGYVGKALTNGGGDGTYPWFVYAGGLAILAGFMKVLADTATRVVDEMEDEDPLDART